MRNHNDEFEYDVALSFATEDRDVGEELGSLLAAKGISVFYDEYRAGANWGDGMVEHLINIYSRKARFGVMLVSTHYPLQKWKEEVLPAVQELTLRDANEHILPIRLDDSEASGIDQAPGYRDLRREPVENIVNTLEKKLAQRIVHPGPPPESHDLRSGNMFGSEEDR